MPYPEELKKLIKIVEGTRAERVARKKAGEEVTFLTLEQRKERLKYHPDFQEEGRRALRVGPSKGYAIAHEFADLLEARSRIDPNKVDLSRWDLETDVLVRLDIDHHFRADDFGLLTELAAGVPDKRVYLFPRRSAGSDAPVRSFATQLGRVLGANLTKNQLRAILSDNARALLKISPSESPRASQ